MWLPAGLCLLLIAVALGILFQAEVVGAYDVWETSTAYNHCFLVLPVAAYLAWVRRDALAGLAPQPDPRILAVLVPLSLMWLLAALLGILEARQLLVVAMFQVMAMAVLGLAVYRAMLTPFLYLFFLVPFGYFLVPYLQSFTAWFTVMWLHIVGIPVYWDGTIIQIPAGTFVVAEACAGLRFLIASVAFGVFFAALMYRSPVRWLLFVALSVAVPIIANGFRAFGLLILAQYSGNTAMVMADHIIYGWGFFTAVTLLLIVIGKSFADEDGSGAAARVVLDGEPAAAVSRTWRFAVVGIVGFSLAALGPAYAQMSAWRVAAIDFGTVPPPGVGAGWQKSAWDVKWTPSVAAPERAFFEVYGDGGAPVARFVALYVTAGLHNNLARGQNAVADFDFWSLRNSGSVRARIAGHEAAVTTTSIERRGKRLLIWSFYVVGNDIIGSRARVKLAQLRELFGKPNPLGAFVAIAADDSDPSHPAADTLAHFLESMPAVPDYFRSLTTGHAGGR